MQPNYNDPYQQFPMQIQYSNDQMEVFPNKSSQTDFNFDRKEYTTNKNTLDFPNNYGSSEYCETADYDEMSLANAINFNSVPGAISPQMDHLDIPMQKMIQRHKQQMDYLKNKHKMQNETEFGEKKKRKDNINTKALKEREKRSKMRDLFKELSFMIYGFDANMDNVSMLMNIINFTKNAKKIIRENDMSKKAMLQTIRKLQSEALTSKGNQAPIIINMNCGDKPAPFYLVQGEGGIVQNNNPQYNINNQNNINNNLSLNQTNIQNTPTPQPTQISQHSTHPNPPTKSPNPPTITSPQIANSKIQNSSTTSTTQRQQLDTSTPSIPQPNKSIKFKVENKTISQTPRILENMAKEGIEAMKSIRSIPGYINEQISSYRNESN